MQSAPRILYLNFHSYEEKHRRKLAGIRRFAKTRGWSVSAVPPEESRPADIKNLLARFRPAGCVVECSDDHNPDLPPRLFGKTPVVHLDPPEKLKWHGAVSVVCDNEAVACAAFAELMAGHPVACAVVTSHRLMHWAETRVQNVAIHPLLSHVSNRKFFDATVGFDDNNSNNSYLRCYSDQFSTGWIFGPKSGNAILDGCIVYWYDSDPGHRHTGLKCDGALKAMVTGMWFGFKDRQAVNTVLSVGEEGGTGFIADPRVREELLNDPADAFRAYLRGSLH